MTSGEVGGIDEGEEGWSKNIYKGHMDKAKRGKDWGWEVVVGGTGESGGGVKVEITVLKHQFKKKKNKKLKKMIVK